jgi:hypothetical protein
MMVGGWSKKVNFLFHGIKFQWCPSPQHLFGHTYSYTCPAFNTFHKINGIWTYVKACAKFCISVSN